MGIIIVHTDSKLVEILGVIYFNSKVGGIIIILRQYPVGHRTLFRSLNLRETVFNRVGYFFIKYTYQKLIYRTWKIFVTKIHTVSVGRFQICISTFAVKRISSSAVSDSRYNFIKTGAANRLKIRSF